MQSSDDMRGIKNIFVGVSFCLLVLTGAGAVDLHGTAAVNITSDTAATAKNMAFDEARRQIITDTLRQYAIVEQLIPAVQNAKSSELMNLISASSIDGEQLSDTTYSANISMTVDVDAARTWMAENNIQNWLRDGASDDRFVVIVNMSDAVANWMDLQQIARNEKIDPITRNMTGNSAMLELPASVRAKFTIALREGGWRYANADGALRIWK
ncbi:MAG: hypothetical protein IJX89_05420 [Alphaproteobacteria bacterium]|nr:hypothetical protein [Alphaproteobacteria bacterium]